MQGCVQNQTVATEISSSATSETGTANVPNLSFSSYKDSKPAGSPPSSYKTSVTAESLDEPGVDYPTAESLASSQAPHTMKSTQVLPLQCHCGVLCITKDDFIVYNEENFSTNRKCFQCDHATDTKGGIWKHYRTTCLKYFL